MQPQDCPCKSGQEYHSCCGPFISADSQAPTAIALMHSRYTAYTQENKDYLIATWDPDTVPVDLAFDGSTVEWTSLRIISQSGGSEADIEGTVEFEACFQAGDRAGKMREKSRFKKQNDAWFYVNGEVARSPNRTIPSTQKVGRNEPCPCGSGKKFKKCCG